MRITVYTLTNPGFSDVMGFRSSVLHSELGRRVTPLNPYANQAAQEFHATLKAIPGIHEVAFSGDNLIIVSLNGSVDRDTVERHLLHCLAEDMGVNINDVVVGNYERQLPTYEFLVKAVARHPSFH